MRQKGELVKAVFSGGNQFISSRTEKKNGGGCKCNRGEKNLKKTKQKKGYLMKV